MIDKDSVTGEKTATPTLSDEQIKLHILDMFKGDLEIENIQPKYAEGLNILFQWIKGE